jgi:tripartite-type tricarboxylate transporter receptor subunit TctC
MIDISRRRWLAGGTGLALAAAAGTARAQGGWPQRPVRLVVPYAAGGGPDLQARKLAPELARALGGNVIVENKVGAGGIVAGEVVATAPADGYTVLIGGSTHLINKAMQPAVKYDPMRSFDAVTQTASGGAVLVVPADAPYRSAKELAAAVKAKPSAFNYGSGGVGTAAHLAGGTFCRLLELDAVHVPFRGSVDIVPGLLGGQVQFAFPISSTAMPAIAQGKVRPLAVTTARRIGPLPEVPTLKELFGSDLMVQESWSGFWLPVGSPREAIEKLFAATRASHETAVVREFYESSGTDIVLSASPAAFSEFMRTEVDKWARIVRLVGATPS